jgi:hypothetical protein
MIGATQIHVIARVHSLDGYSGAPTRRSGSRYTRATPTMLIPSCLGVP